MKKLIGILGVAVIAMAMFFSTNSLNNSSGDLDLASLLNMNTANAEAGATVRMPTPVLCPDKTKYKTDCTGSGEGCNMGEC
jgi:hypothetical protein